MKSLNNLTGKDQLATSIPFFKPVKEHQDFTKELIGDYSDEQIDEINGLVQDIATQTLVRFMNFLFNAETDKQLIARVICLQKLFNNKHGNWSALANGHNVTIKSIRAERDRIQQETRVIHSIIMKYHIIYKTTNLINDKFYIGKHSTDNLDDGYLGSSQHLKSAIKKYGKENFKREIICYCNSEQEAYEKEAELVTMEVVKNPMTYNKMLGGEGSNKRVTDEEFKENRRESSRKWKEVNRERERENNRRWREANREHILERNREYRQANKERAREYYQANKESIREYYQANKERIREYQREYKREWYKANKERFLEYKREWYKANKERKQKYISK